MTYQNESAARTLIHSAVGCDPNDDECVRITDLLNLVEDDRAHAEAGRLREKADAFTDSKSDLVAGAMAAATRLAAVHIDPYEMRDGNLVRKSDGKIIKHKEQQA